MSPRRLRLAVLLVVMPSGLAAAGGAQACLTAPRAIVRTVITNAAGSQVPADVQPTFQTPSDSQS